jgi:hypothetical protein
LNRIIGNITFFSAKSLYHVPGITMSNLYVPRHDVLGLDIGRVITNDARHGEFDIFSEYYLYSVPRPGATSTIRDLVNRRYGDDVHLISKAKQKIEGRMTELLHHWRFFERTGVLEKNVHFCRTDAEKTEIATALGVTEVVDDKVGVLNRMPERMRRILFVPSDERPPRDIPEGIIPALGWEGIRHELLLPLEAI